MPIDRLRADILIATARVERERLRRQIDRLTRGNVMARDLASLETALGLFDSDMDAEAGKVFDKIDAVRAKAPDVFKRTHARIDEKAKTVDRVDALLTSLDRANRGPTSAGSSSTSRDSSAIPPPVPVLSAEKKT